MVKALKTLLVRNVQNPIVRSALINLVLTVSVAAVTVLQAQLDDGHINLSLIVGAATLAFSKWVHSTATDLVRKYEQAS